MSWKERQRGKEREGKREGKDRTYLLSDGGCTGSLPAEDTSTMIINDSMKINSLLLRIGALPVIAVSCL